VPTGAVLAVVRVQRPSGAGRRGTGPWSAARLPRVHDLAPIDEGTLAYVQKATARTITSTHEDIYAREADDLDIAYGIAPPGRPVLVVEYDADQRPLTLETAVFPERIRVVSRTPPS
jgi:DNA-binding GntR family transcriptional regulator